MNLLNKYKVSLTILFLLMGFFLFKDSLSIGQQNPQKEATQEKQLKIVSTKPNPLDNAIILPTQDIEITFNMPVMKSEVKHKFDPETLEYDLEVLNGINTSYGQTFRFKFKKPLQLGSGLTLFILPNTHTEDGIKLDQEFIYHIKTISYQGV
ncbi:MAG: hypothetical protein HYW45_01885 [Candidatus Daviesbacteria bacterium]|nr:MAG: hypothetical protein HYW45_01885 [Candidatus Daviesbacteria bacterium]